MLKQNIKKLINIILVPFVISDFFKFKKRNHKSDRLSLLVRDINPQIKDKTLTTGFDRHYVYHTAWAIRKVKEINPALHVDISSTLYFCATLSAFVPVDFYDYRPPELSLPNLSVKKGDLLALPFLDSSVSSLSCMHTVEHVGLGRYGDPLDPNGDLKSISELKRIVKKDGSLLFVVPIGGVPKIIFNAHRIYSYDQIIELFKDFKLQEFSLIPEAVENGGLLINASKEMADREKYGCGCFWFIKK